MGMNLKSVSPALIIGLVIGIYVFTALLPGALDNIFAVNTTAWDAGTASLWVVLPLIIVALFLLKFSGQGAGKGGE